MGYINMYTGMTQNEWQFYNNTQQEICMAPA